MIDRRAVAAILAAGAVVLPRTALSRAPVVCPFRRVTGLPCPACGLTRSWQAAAHLHLVASLGHHPLGAATLLGAIAIALDGTDPTPAVAERRSVRAAAIGVWIATWLWRVRRAAVLRG